MTKSRHKILYHLECDNRKETVQDKNTMIDRLRKMLRNRENNIIVRQEKVSRLNQNI